MSRPMDVSPVEQEDKKPLWNKVVMVSNDGKGISLIFDNIPAGNRVLLIAEELAATRTQVQVIPREEYVDLTLNRLGYHVETSEHRGTWTAYLIGDRLEVVCKTHGQTRLEALEAMAGALGEKNGHSPEIARRTMTPQLEETR